jgi:hypothetical protein
MLGEDETSKRVPTTPAKPGEVIHKGDGLNPMESSDASYFRSMTALTVYMMQWSRPEISNTSRSCARVMSNPKVGHMDSIKHLARYMVGTPNRGLVLAPKRVWSRGSVVDLIHITLHARMFDAVSPEAEVHQ